MRKILKFIWQLLKRLFHNEELQMILISWSVALVSMIILPLWMNIAFILVCMALIVAFILVGSTFLLIDEWKEFLEMEEEKENYNE